MALIGKIRQRSGLIIVLMALALAGFIIMDMTSSNKSGNLFDTSTTVGKIAGEKIDYVDFQRKEDILYNGSNADAFARRNFLWNYLIQEKVVGQEAEALGLGVSKEELLDLQFGNNISPVMLRSFGNPQTGEVNREMLNQYKGQIESNTLDPQIRQYWAEQEKQIITDRLQSKISDMVTKAIYTPSWMAEMLQKEQTEQVAFDYVKVPFDKVADSEVTMTDADYQAFLNENKGTYLREKEGRKLEYVTFFVTPSAKDSAVAKEKVLTALPGLRAATNDSAFIATQEGGLLTPTFVKKSDVKPDNIADSLFNANVGKVVGPYFDNGNYTIAKVVAKSSMPDSARVRHILIGVGQASPAGRMDAPAKKLADSLLAVIRANPAKFAELAKTYSDDGGSKDKGGEYTWHSSASLYPEYYDYTFKNGKVGDFQIVKTAQGGYHIMNLMGYKGGRSTLAKIALVRSALQPSEETQQAANDKALALQAKCKTVEDLRKVAEAEKLQKEVSQPFEENDYALGNLGQGATPREIIKWAYDARVNSVAPNVYGIQEDGKYYVNRYVVAGLRDIMAPGLPSVASVKEEIEVAAKNRKKGEILKEKIGSNRDFSNIASTYGGLNDKVPGANFAAQFIPGFGNEPKVIAAAFGTNINEVSAPIAGYNGVFLVKPTNKQQGTAADLKGVKQSSVAQSRNAIASRLLDSMRKNVSISDNRSKFF